MTIRLYFDEDSMDHQLVRALRARGMDVKTALDENMINRGDEEHTALFGRRANASNFTIVCFEIS